MIAKAPSFRRRFFYNLRKGFKELKKTQKSSFYLKLKGLSLQPENHKDCVLQACVLQIRIFL